MGSARIKEHPRLTVSTDSGMLHYELQPQSQLLFLVITLNDLPQPTAFHFLQQLRSRFVAQFAAAISSRATEAPLDASATQLIRSLCASLPPQPLPPTSAAVDELLRIAKALRLERDDADETVAQSAFSTPAPLCPPSCRPVAEALAPSHCVRTTTHAPGHCVHHLASLGPSRAPRVISPLASGPALSWQSLSSGVAAGGLPRHAPPPIGAAAIAEAPSAASTAPLPSAALVLHSASHGFAHGGAAGGGVGEGEAEGGDEEEGADEATAETTTMSLSEARGLDLS